MKQVSIDYEPQPKQALLHQTKARQILYGGAAGGGKSKSIRMDGVLFALQNPGLNGALFRRTLAELEDNHIRWIKNEVPQELGEYNETKKIFNFRNGSAIRFCYCEKEQDVTRYQGGELHWIGIDEAAHLTDFQISYLKNRNRLGSWVPQKDKDRLPRFVMGSNPGGVGHTFLKQSMIDPAPPMTLFHDKTMRDPKRPDDPGWLSIFIPARMEDNKFIDEDYGSSFGGLPPEYARALREGDWDAVVGQALHTLSRERHMLRPFSPPKHWTRFMVVDWGTASPFAVGWYTVSEGAELRGRESWPDRWLPSGAVIQYDEWYGWNGRANQGLRMAPQVVARGIIEREEARGDVMDYRVGDTEMWAMKSGPSIVEWMQTEDARLIFRQSQKDRKRNYQEILARLAGNQRFVENGRVEEDPMFFATANCTHFWRTVPSLVLDDIDPEKGPDTKQEDHPYDITAYACRSRPYVSTKEDRYIADFGDEMNEALRKVADPYATA